MNKVNNNKNKNLRLRKSKGKWSKNKKEFRLKPWKPIRNKLKRKKPRKPNKHR
jgi:hypothetical protein